MAPRPDRRTFTLAGGPPAVEGTVTTRAGPGRAGTRLDYAARLDRCGGGPPAWS
ncbi:MAG: hypothetical protein ACRD0D_00970 [Acidimicrobiales bacterium]